MPRTGTTSPCTWSTRPGRRAELIARAGSGPATSAAALLAVALAKSAQVPLHFWLPRAMAAPTAVSAYLPSAAMVAAGVLPLGRGVIAVLASSVATETAAIITFALLAIAFVVLTSPVSGHAIARSARRRTARRR